jgi:hypothetical protein
VEATRSTIRIHCAYHALAAPAELRPNLDSPNKHPAKQIQLYGAAILAHGWRESLTVSKRSGLLVRGHGARLAAISIGATVVPAEYQDYASDEEELADRLADNRLSHLSTTDAVLLKAAFKKLPLSAITGYTGTEIEDLLAELAPPAEFPITAQLNERHDYVVITTDSETDWQFLKNLAGVRTERSFKNKRHWRGPRRSVRALPSITP